MNKTSTSLSLVYSTALFLCFALLGLFQSEAHARNQRGYVKKNGTYVHAHQKTNPDSKRYNNRSARSNGGTQRDEFSSPPKYNKRRN